jgi:HD superfamily phosphohydrolase
MYKNVYYHRVVRGAEGMVKLALSCARRLAVQDRLAWPSRDHPLHKALVGNTLNPSEFHELDDVSLMASFQEWTRGDDASLAGLCFGLLNRKLFKSIDVSDCSNEIVAKLMNQIAAWIDQHGGESAYDLFLDQSGDSAMETGILLKSSDGSTRDFMTHSPLVRILDQQLRFKRICVKPEYRQEIKQAFFGG